METVYEKVCPACGRSATLAAKFCSGCGHQYRTVFHDQAGSADGDNASDSGSRNDLRTALLVALIPVIIVLLIVSARPQTVQVATGASPAAVTALTSPASTPTIIAGMRPIDVQQALGRPNSVKVVPIAGVTTQQWYYTRDGHTLEVDFNSNNLVNNWTSY